MAMSWQNYLSDTKDNALNFIDETFSEFDSWDDLYDELILSDDVTGNASGSYTFNAKEAAENLTYVIWDDEVHEIFDMYGMKFDLSNGPETLDVLIRIVAIYELQTDLEDYYISLVSQG